MYAILLTVRVSPIKKRTQQRKERKEKSCRCSSNLRHVRYFMDRRQHFDTLVLYNNINVTVVYN